MQRLIALLPLLAFASIAPRAQQGIFYLELPPEVLPVDVGANAFAVVGSYFEGGALSWMPTSGTRSLGGMSGISISRDGKTVIGRALDARGFENAAIWQGGDRWRLLGPLRPDARPCDNLVTGTFGASDDGKVIVGLGWDGCAYARAFRWEESTGMADLGSMNVRSTRANEVSGDGRVVIGFQESDVGFRQGAKWVNGQPELIRNAAGRVVGEAFGANHDGSIIVGGNCDPFNPNSGDPQATAAWKWTASAGMQCFPIIRPAFLPNLPYSTRMRATSDDGRVIGGSYTFGLDAEALIWLDGEPHFLQDYLRTNGVPEAFRRWVNTGFVTGVSRDGRTLVGYGAGPTAFRGYLVILPERASK